MNAQWKKLTKKENNEVIVICIIGVILVAALPGIGAIIFGFMIWKYL